MVPIRSLRSATLVATLVFAACSGGGTAGPVGAGAAASPAPAPAIPDVSGEWSGFVSVEGQGIDGTLVLEQDGESLDAVFQAPSFGLAAEGTGTVSADGRVAIELTYNLQCPGQARMAGDLSADGMAMDGQLEAGDCTGSMLGSFRFTR